MKTTLQIRCDGSPVLVKAHPQILVCVLEQQTHFSQDRDAWICTNHIFAAPAGSEPCLNIQRKNCATQVALHGTCSTTTARERMMNSAQIPKTQMNRFYSSESNDLHLSLPIRDFTQSTSFSDVQARCIRSVAIIEIWTITVLKFEERIRIVPSEASQMARVARGYHVERDRAVKVKELHATRVWWSRAALVTWDVVCWELIVTRIWSVSKVAPHHIFNIFQKLLNAPFQMKCFWVTTLRSETA